VRWLQVEEGLRGLGFDRLVIYRPGVLCGGDRYVLLVSRNGTGGGVEGMAPFT
jgi:hypothetical protein